MIVLIILLAVFIIFLVLDIKNIDYYNDNIKSIISGIILGIYLFVIFMARLESNGNVAEFNQVKDMIENTNEPTIKDAAINMEAIKDNAWLARQKRLRKAYWLFQSKDIETLEYININK